MCSASHELVQLVMVMLPSDSREMCPVGQRAMLSACMLHNHSLPEARVKTVNIHVWPEIQALHAFLRVEQKRGNISGDLLTPPLEIDDS